MLRRLLMLVFVFFISHAVKSQLIYTDSLSDFSQSVVLRVYDIGIRVPLTISEQTALGSLFQAEEVELYNEVLNGASIDRIDSIKKNYLTSFNALLDPAKRDEYYQQKAAEKADILANVKARMLQLKYNTDDSLAAYFKSIYTWRENLIERIWMASADTSARNSNLLFVAVAYDTLLSKYVRAAAGMRYLTDRIHSIDSILPIDSLKRTELIGAYVSNCMQYKNLSYADNFSQAFSASFQSLNDSLYYEAAFPHTIIEQMEAAASEALVTYVKQDRLSPYTISLITPYIIAREREVTFINRIYPGYSYVKDSLINFAYQKYQPIIDSIAGFDVQFSSISQIEIAIRFANELELTVDQISNLQSALAELRILQENYLIEDPLGEYDSRAYESEQLNSILTPEQYTDVLIAKYQGKAQNWAKLDWLAMQEEDIAHQYDSITVSIELNNYHLALFVAYYRNGNNTEEQHLSISRINEVMPQCKRELLELWEYQTPYADLPDTFFQW